MPLNDNQRRLRRAKQRERDSGRWLLDHDGADPRWAGITSSTGRVGHINQLQFDVVSRHYAGEVKNVKAPALLNKWWRQITEIALVQGKDPLIIWYPTNEVNVLGVPKKTKPFHIITEERHEQLLFKETIADGLVKFDAYGNLYTRCECPECPRHATPSR
jgi:hypothetical protein